MAIDVTHGYPAGMLNLWLYCVVCMQFVVNFLFLYNLVFPKKDISEGKNRHAGNVSRARRQSEVHRC